MSEQDDPATLRSVPTRRQLMAGALAFGSLAFSSVNAWAGVDDGVSHTAETIHQEPVFRASRRRVYEALTDAGQFNKVSQLSAAMKSGMALGNRATEISREEGGAFTIFGGHILGRQIELVPNQRIVQAWRVVDWTPGLYSIVKFELAERGFLTKLIFDHTGFPAGDGQHLAEGWKANYWQPLEKYLA